LENQDILLMASARGETRDMYNFNFKKTII